MGRHTDPTATGSRRAAVLTLTASALLVAGGVLVAHEAADRPPRPAEPSTSTTSVPTLAPSAPAAGS
jgi:hypothetical protein